MSTVSLSGDADAPAERAGGLVGDRGRLLGEHYRARRRLSRLATSTSDIAREVARYGIAIRPEFVDADTVATLAAAVPPIEQFKTSPEGTAARYIDWAYDIAPLTAFYDDERIDRAMHELLGVGATRLRCTVQERHVVGNISFENFFHIDTWLPRFKAFLFLTDVSPDNGPLVYVPKSHLGLWRLRLERDVQKDFVAGDDGYIHSDLAAYTGCLFPHQARRLFGSHDLTPVTAVVDAGTLVVMDGRGLHRATPLRSGRRLMLSSYWTLPGRHN